MRTQLQAMRKKAGFKSAKAFADSIGMNPATYTDYEQGRRAFTLEKAWEFADVLECSLDELAGRRWPPEDLASIDPRRRAMVDAYDSLTDDGKTLASEMVASVARDPLRRADAPGAGGAGPQPAQAGERVSA